MIILVSGGAGSGKSACAEQLLLRCPAQRRIYLATMRATDAESHARVARHRAQRAGKGFLTVECPCELGALSIPAGSAVLLEDLSNLTANECFSGAGFAGARQRILTGLAALRARWLIIVTNELFSDGECYPELTARYLALLAQLNRDLAAHADGVVEVVAGIPVWWKGREDALF